MLEKTNPLWGIDDQGLITFKTRDRLIKMREKPDSLWNHPIILVLILILCCIIDFAVFKSLFDSFLLDEPIVRWLSIGAMMFCFNVLPIYTGLSLRKRVAGYNISKVLIGSMIGCFSIGFIVNVMLRIAFKDLVMPDLTLASTSIYGNVNADTSVSSRALPYAIFASVLPLITSVGSFLISFSMFSPLQKELTSLQKEHNKICDRIGQLESILREYDCDKDFHGRLTQDDEDKYAAMKAMILQKTEAYRNHVRMRLKEHLGTATDNSALSTPLKRII